MKKYEIEKDKYLNKWVVFERLSANMQEQVYSSKLKRDCINFVRARDKK